MNLFQTVSHKSSNFLFKNLNYLKLKYMKKYFWRTFKQKDTHKKHFSEIIIITV
jgi:hypothetical protein